MSSKKNILLSMLSADLSSTFLKVFSQRIPVIYQEAISRSVKDDAIDNSLKRYYLGQTRYALAQSMFLNVSRECGHQTDIDECETNGFPIPKITIGRFSFTLHHGTNPNEMSVINASIIRQQHSAINDEIIQPKLFGATFNEHKLAMSENIVGNIIFGCRMNSGDFAKYGFLRIAVPYLKKTRGKDKLCFAENLDFFDVLKMVVGREQQEQQKSIINVAVPKIKISKLG